MNGTPDWTALDAAEISDPAARVRWLEERIVSLDLGPLIDELTVLAGASANRVEPAPQSVRSWLGPDATAVLEQGLVRLPPGKLAELSCQPALLSGLQELVLREGGAHWNNRLRANAALATLAARHRRGLVQKLSLDARGKKKR